MEWLSRLLFEGFRTRPDPNLEPWLVTYGHLIGKPRDGKPFVLTREKGRQILIDRPAYEFEHGQRKGIEPNLKELDEALGRSDRVRVFDGGIYNDEPLGVVILLDSMDPLLLSELRSALAVKESALPLKQCRGLGSPTLEFSSGSERLATVTLREGRYLRLARWRRDVELADPEALRTVLNRLHIEPDETNDVDTIRSLYLLSLSRADRHAQRAESYRVQGQVARAAEECERALAIDPRSWNAVRTRASLHHQQGELEEAEKRYTEALSLGAPAADTLRLRALARSSRGWHPQALEDCEKARRVDPANGEVHMTRAMILMAMNRHSEARQAFDQAERNSHNKAAILWNRAMLEYEVSCFPQATEVLDRLIAHMKEPGYTPPPSAARKEAGAHRELSLDLCSAHLQRARARANMNLHDEAFDDFAQAQKLDPMNLLTYEWRAMLHQQRDEFGPALRDCDRMVELSPGETSYVYRAHVRSESGDLDGALDDLGQALEIANEPYRIHGIRGQLLLNAERITEARAEFDELLQHKPDEAAAYYLRSRCWRHLGIYEEQRDDLVQALAIEPENVFALNSLSWLYSTCPDDDIRNGKQAVELGRKAVSTAGYNPHFLDTLAAGHAEVGEFDAACQLMRRAIAIFKNHLPAPALEEYRNRLSLYEAEEPYRESL
jgi:tetratricopeptide (TPR) repeat protein